MERQSLLTIDRSGRETRDTIDIKIVSWLYEKRGGRIEEDEV